MALKMFISNRTIIFQYNDDENNSNTINNLHNKIIEYLPFISKDTK